MPFENVYPHFEHSYQCMIVPRLLMDFLLCFTVQKVSSFGWMNSSILISHSFLLNCSRTPMIHPPTSSSAASTLAIVRAITSASTSSAP